MGVISFPLLSALWAFLWLFFGSKLAHLAIFFASRKEQGVVLSSGKRRDPLACIDPPLTVKVAVSEGQSRGEVSFGEGKTPSPPSPVGVCPPPKTP